MGALDIAPSCARDGLRRRRRSPVMVRPHLGKWHWVGGRCALGGPHGSTRRAEGFDASAATLIETVRLARSLAALRDRPSLVFEEMRDATISTLMMGEPLQWRIIENRLLLGALVGAIPTNLPRAPLLEDLQKQQMKSGMRPEAPERELALVLRTQRGLNRATLLHRLIALDVPWGQASYVSAKSGHVPRKMDTGLGC